MRKHNDEIPRSGNEWKNDRALNLTACSVHIVEKFRSGLETGRPYSSFNSFRLGN